MATKIGSIVYATEQGLGILAKAFHDNGLIDKVLIVPHGSRETHHDWFKNSQAFTPANYDWLLKDIDVLLLFETPFDWKIIPEARKRGVKTVFMPMYECTGTRFHYEPDLILCPSELDYEVYKHKNAVFLPIPVDNSWTLRRKAEVFIHNAGHGGLGMRNGTPELIEAMKSVKSPIKLIIRSQSHDFKVSDPRITVFKGTVPYEDLWEEGDVFIFPEKFNGLSLPLQEAYASGMLVMASDRFPMNRWLPTEPLIPVRSYKTERIGMEFKSAVIDPLDIAKKIDEWYDKDIEEFSLRGKNFATTHSWKNLKPKYLAEFEKLKTAT